MDIEERLTALEARLTEAEDRLAILGVIGAYGPAVDSCSAPATGALWSREGSYDFGSGMLEGAAAVGDLVNLGSHRGYVAQGCAHVMGVPRIVVKGDRATAAGPSCVLLRDGAHWRVERASANLWELERTPSGWKVARRINRLMDGGAAGPALMREGIGDLEEEVA